MGQICAAVRNWWILKAHSHKPPNIFIVYLFTMYKCQRWKLIQETGMSWYTTRTDYTSFEDLQLQVGLYERCAHRMGCIIFCAFLWFVWGKRSHSSSVCHNSDPSGKIQSIAPETLPRVIHCPNERLSECMEACCLWYGQDRHQVGREHVRRLHEKMLNYVYDMR